MKRREFIAMLGGAAVAWPVAAMAQKDARIARAWLKVRGLAPLFS